MDIRKVIDTLTDANRQYIMQQITRLGVSGFLAQPYVKTLVQQVINRTVTEGMRQSAIDMLYHEGQPTALFCELAAQRLMLAPRLVFLKPAVFSLPTALLDPTPQFSLMLVTFKPLDPTALKNMRVACIVEQFETMQPINLEAFVRFIPPLSIEERRFDLNLSPRMVDELAEPRRRRYIDRSTVQDAPLPLLLQDAPHRSRPYVDRPLSESRLSFLVQLRKTEPTQPAQLLIKAAPEKQADPVVVQATKSKPVVIPQLSFHKITPASAGEASTAPAPTRRR
ncbi:MAG: hypothetical protein NTW08_02335 [Gammaproteobacteria bacterium]|nr:hypothetical protein [Gammaproteobacteria bacterium]